MNLKINQTFYLFFTIYCPTIATFVGLNLDQGLWLSWKWQTFFPHPIFMINSKADFYITILCDCCPTPKVPWGQWLYEIHDCILRKPKTLSRSFLRIRNMFICLRCMATYDDAREKVAIGHVSDSSVLKYSRDANVLKLFVSFIKIPRACLNRKWVFCFLTLTIEILHDNRFCLRNSVGKTFRCYEKVILAHHRIYGFQMCQNL